VAAFSWRNAATMKKTIRRALKDMPNEIQPTLKALDNIRRSIVPWYRSSIKPHSASKGFGWLRHPDHYRYVRQMFQQRRIAIIKGNLLTDKAMPSISRSARRLGVPVRLFYVSNADELWQLTPQYRKNIAELPFDERSVVLRTLLPRWRARGPKLEQWDYLVHCGKQEQQLIVRPGWKWTWWFGKDARRVSSYLLAAGLPARTARQKASSP